MKKNKNSFEQSSNLVNVFDFLLKSNNEKAVLEFVKAIDWRVMDNILSKTIYYDGYEKTIITQNPHPPIISFLILNRFEELAQYITPEISDKINKMLKINEKHDLIMEIILRNSQKDIELVIEKEIFKPESNTNIFDLISFVASRPQTTPEYFINAIEKKYSLDFFDEKKLGFYNAHYQFFHKAVQSNNLNFINFLVYTKKVMPIVDVLFQLEPTKESSVLVHRIVNEFSNKKDQGILTELISFSSTAFADFLFNVQLEQEISKKEFLEQEKKLIKQAEYSQWFCNLISKTKIKNKSDCDISYAMLYSIFYKDNKLLELCKPFMKNNMPSFEIMINGLLENNNTKKSILTDNEFHQLLLSLNLSSQQTFHFLKTIYLCEENNDKKSNSNILSLQNKKDIINLFYPMLNEAEKNSFKEIAIFHEKDKKRSVEMEKFIYQINSITNQEFKKKIL